MSRIKQFNGLPEMDFTGGWTLEKIQEKLESDYGASMEAQGQKGTLSKSSPMKLQIMAEANMLYQIVVLIDQAGKGNFLQYAEGAALDNLASFKRITRREASRASVTLRFSMTNARVSATPIPAGIRVCTEDLRYFAVASYVEIPAGEQSVLCEAFALDAGEEMNGIAIGQINQIVDPLPYIAAVTNVNVSSGGTDIESDDELTYRVYMAPSGYSVAGPKDAYEYYARSYRADISDAHATTPEAAHVNVMFLLDGGVIPDEEIIAGLEEFLSDDKIRPLGDRVTVTVPEEVEYNIALTYYVAKSVSGQAVSIQAAVNAAVSEYQVWQRAMGRDINPSRLIELIRAAGAKRCEVTSPVFTVIEDGEIAKVGTVSITYGGLEDD